MTTAAAGPLPPTSPEDAVVSLEELRQREIARRRALAAHRAGQAAGAPVAPAEPFASSMPDSPAAPPAARPSPTSIAALTFLPAQPFDAEAAAEPAAFPDGFADASAWQRALAYTAEHAGPDPDGERSALTQAELWEVLGHAIRAMDDPVQGLAVLHQAGRSGLPPLPFHEEVRADALIRDKPYLAAGESAPLWQVYELTHRISRVRLPSNQQKFLLAVLPLAVLDDFIDEGWLTTAPEPDGTHRTAYLRARLTPESLNSDELTELGWTLEQERRSATPESRPGPEWPESWHLLLRLQQADETAVHEQWPGLSESARQLLNDLKGVARTGDVPERLAQDVGLWQLLERLAPMGNSHSKLFRNWLVVRRMLRALKQAHRAELHSDPQRAAARFDAAWDIAEQLQHSSQSVLWEARNVSAYLAAFRNLLQAIDLLDRDAENRPPRQAELGLSAMETLIANRAFLESLPMRDSTRVLNPYLLLDVPDDSPEWKRTWRNFFRRLEDDGRAVANAARDSIEFGKREHGGEAPYFRVPLAPLRWADRTDSSPLLALPPEPMSRQTEPPTAAEHACARDGAAREIIDSITTPNAADDTPARPESPESSTL